MATAGVSCGHAARNDSAREVPGPMPRTFSNKADKTKDEGSTAKTRRKNGIHQHIAKMKSRVASASNGDTNSDINLESAPALFLSVFAQSIVLKGQRGPEPKSLSRAVHCASAREDGVIIVHGQFRVIITINHV